MEPSLSNKKFQPKLHFQKPEDKWNTKRYRKKATELHSAPMNIPCAFIWCQWKLCFLVPCQMEMCPLSTWRSKKIHTAYWMSQQQMELSSCRLYCGWSHEARDGRTFFFPLFTLYSSPICFQGDYPLSRVCCIPHSLQRFARLLCDTGRRRHLNDNHNPHIYFQLFNFHPSWASYTLVLILLRNFRTTVCTRVAVGWAILKQLFRSNSLPRRRYYWLVYIHFNSESWRVGKCKILVRCAAWRRTKGIFY